MGSKSMASLVRKCALFHFSSASFLLLFSPPATINFPFSAIYRTKMADLGTEIKSKGERKRYKTQGKSKVCEKKPSQNFPQFKHDVDVIAMIDLQKCPWCLNLDRRMNPNAS